MAYKRFYLKDYQAPSFTTQKVELWFTIVDDHVLVESLLTCEKQSATETEAWLDGEGLELLQWELNGDQNYPKTLSDKGISFKLPTNEQSFTIRTKVKINPFNNTSGMGLYYSDGLICSQCEAEGARRITYLQDRPDVLSLYSVHIKAHKSRYNHLLSNGNLIKKHEDADFLHAEWDDPFKKPSYLFALVVGNLKEVKGEYDSPLRKKSIELAFYVDHGNEDKVTFAMEALKQAMAWDEKVFGLAYDLDLYQVVAVNAFNFGAMENKGLNVFVASLLLADPLMTPDSQYEFIRNVVGHEYFHNYTGNRVTLKNWFQIALKEGLTVYRDQQFAVDHGDKILTEIERILYFQRAVKQEDGSPLRHPPRPDSYETIDNFYTSTIYFKGAEIIRMFKYWLGEAELHKRIKIYLDQFDGQAAALEDLVGCLLYDRPKYIEPFMRWYRTSGEVQVKARYENEVLTLDVGLHADSPNQEPLVFPFRFSVYNRSGEKLMTKELLIEEKTTSMNLKLGPGPLLFSLNEEHRAPVVLPDELSFDDQLILARSAQDPLQRVIWQKNVNMFCLRSKEDLTEKCVELYQAVLEDRGVLNSSVDYKVKLLAPISLESVLQEEAHWDLPFLQNKWQHHYSHLALSFKDHWLSLVEQHPLRLPYQFDPKAVSYRRMRYLALWYCAMGGLVPNLDEQLLRDLKHTDNATDSQGLLSLILDFYPHRFNDALAFVEDACNKNHIVLQNLLSVVSRSPQANWELVTRLSAFKQFDWKKPHMILNLFTGFFSNSVVIHNQPEFYYPRFFETLTRVDAINANASSQLASTSLRNWRKLTKDKQTLLLRELENWQGQNKDKVSTHVHEVLKTLFPQF